MVFYPTRFHQYVQSLKVRQKGRLPNIYSDNRIELFHMFKKYYKEIYLVYFSIKTETLINQNEEREFPVPLDVLQNFRRRYETPTEKEIELFKGIYKVENHDIEPIVDKILEDEKSNA